MKSKTFLKFNLVIMVFAIICFLMGMSNAFGISTTIYHFIGYGLIVLQLSCLFIMIKLLKKE